MSTGGKSARAELPYLTLRTHLTTWPCLESRGGGELVAVCRTCVGYGSKKSSLLSKACSGRVAAHRAGVLRRVERGLHPSDKAHLRDLRLC